MPSTTYYFKIFLNLNKTVYARISDSNAQQKYNSRDVTIIDKSTPSESLNFEVEGRWCTALWTWSDTGSGLAAQDLKTLRWCKVISSGDNIAVTTTSITAITKGTKKYSFTAINNHFNIVYDGTAFLLWANGSEWVQATPTDQARK